jgi:hypothetical protein
MFTDRAVRGVERDPRLSSTLPPLEVDQNPVQETTAAAEGQQVNARLWPCGLQGKWSASPSVMPDWRKHLWESNFGARAQIGSRQGPAFPKDGHP